MTNKNNSGHSNSGEYNSGNHNSGHSNSGNHNSGEYNSGHSNSGYCNSGHSNSGNYNSGNHNSGYCNSGNYNSGFFNTDEPYVRMFGKCTGLKRYELTVPWVNLKTNQWIAEEEMTEQQKLDDPDFDIKQGTLVTITYHEAWKIYWEQDSTSEQRQQFLDLPNFDADIFKEITGIDAVETKQETCEGKAVEIEGRKYKLTEISDD